MSRPTIVITQIGTPTYFQHFILGFYELKKIGEISLRFRCGLSYWISTVLPECDLVGALLERFHKKTTDNSYLLRGIVINEGSKKKFCIDCADSPYLFDTKSLDEVDIYFKMQCPKTFDIDNGFRLTDNVRIPYSDYRIGSGVSLLKDNIHKVRPLMVGFRRIARMNSYSALKAGINNYKSNACVNNRKKLMCYFGNALGPKPSVSVIKPDWNNESDIMGYYKNLLNHPNEKRARAAKIMAEKGDMYDPRIISKQSADQKSSIRNESIVVPLRDFCGHISNFEYNLNISGYRMSIPNRFIESFIVGTAILTDKLSVKWYLPFEEEVKETVEMGYLPNEAVDWNKFEIDVNELPLVDKKRILELYENKWSPIKVSKYILETTLGSANSKCSMLVDESFSPITIE